MNKGNTKFDFLFHLIQIHYNIRTSQIVMYFVPKTSYICVLLLLELVFLIFANRYNLYSKLTDDKW